MIYRNILRKILTQFLDELEFKLNKILRKHSSLSIGNIVIFSIIVVFLFLISGGIASIATGQPATIIITGFSSQQTVVEFFTYFIIHIFYLISLYLIYDSLRKTRIDYHSLAFGMVIFIIFFLAELYIILFAKGAAL